MPDDKSGFRDSFRTGIFVGTYSCVLIGFAAFGFIPLYLAFLAMLIVAIGGIYLL